MPKKYLSLKTADQINTILSFVIHLARKDTEQ